jgi:DNA-binding transcriptional ArsR family regulator
MEAALRAIAEPRRRRILQLVTDEELSAGEIASHFDVSRPAISQHLTVLKGAGLVTERREGTRRLYLVRTEGLDEIREFLDRFWGDGLERLKAAAEQKEKEQR